MNRRLILCTAPALAVALAFAARAASPQPDSAGPPLAHAVYFKLKDGSKPARDAFVASCKKYLTGHAGAGPLAVGLRAEDVSEPVSVKDWDVSLHVVFDSKESEAKYLVAPRHLAFVEENRPQFAVVRVFDSYLVPAE